MADPETDRRHTETLQKLWKRLAPELLALLRSGENFKVVLNSTSEGKQILIEATKHLKIS